MNYQSTDLLAKYALQYQQQTIPLMTETNYNFLPANQAMSYQLYSPYSESVFLIKPKNVKTVYPVPFNFGKCARPTDRQYQPFETGNKIYFSNLIQK